MAATPRARRTFVAVVGGVLVTAAFAAAAVVSRHLFERPEDEPATVPHRRPTLNEPQPADGSRFRVAAVQGSVECLHDGKLYLLQAGDLLSASDVLRTPRGSRALVRRGGSEIEVRENVEIRLDRLALETASFGLLRGGGNVVATVEGAGEAVEITAKDARSVNQGASRWIVALDPHGKVSVAVAKGAVKFAARGKEVQVPAGQESTAAPGAQPSDPESIPEDLLLSVVWPELGGAGATTAKTEVRGKVRPSTRVRVNGEEANVGPDGAFVAPVPLRPGANPVRVDAEDVLGRTKSESGVVRRAPPAPVLEKASEELWQK